MSPAVVFPNSESFLEKLRVSAVDEVEISGTAIGARDPNNPL